MLKDEINLMLLSLMKNEKKFKNFYTSGYFPYSKDKSFKGAVAIINNKAIVSFIEDINDENKVIATASFLDNTTIIVQLNGKDFLRTQFNNLPRRCKCSSNLDNIISDISSIQRHCAEAEQKLTSKKTNFIRNIFSKTNQVSSHTLSKQDVTTILKNTIDKLDKTQSLTTRNEISPKVYQATLKSNPTSYINHSINDNEPEI